MKPKGVIFDFDGVLFDSLGLHLDGWFYAFREVFKKELDKDVLQSLIGRSTTGIAKLLTENEKSSQKAEQLISLKHEYIEREGTFASMFPGVSDCMGLLTDWGVPFGIASHSPRSFIEKHLRKEKLHVNVIIGLEDCRALKPSPEPFFQCARAMKVEFIHHSVMLVMEDSVPGIVAANRAGMISVGIASQHSVKKLYDGGARVVCQAIVETASKEWMIKTIADRSLSSSGLDS